MAPLGASRRSARQENEDLTAASGAGLARDAGPDATAGSGADPAGWASPADGFDTRPGGPAATEPAGRARTPRPAATSGGRTTAPRCWVTGRPTPWEETGRPPGAVPAAAAVAATGLGVAEAAGAGLRGRARQRVTAGTPTAAAANAGGWAGRPRATTRRRRTSRKRTPVSVGPGSGTPRSRRPRPGTRRIRTPALDTGRPRVLRPRRRGSGGASGPYPGPSGGSGELALRAWPRPRVPWRRG